MEEHWTKVFVYDPLNAAALGELLGRDATELVEEGRAAMAPGWHLVFAGQSKRWGGCSVASLLRDRATGALTASMASKPLTGVLTRRQLPIVLGDDEAAYGFVLRLGQAELEAYERARHNPRHFKRVSLNVLVREDDGRSFTEIEARTYVLQPELMAAEFSVPSSAYLEALRSTLRRYWQVDGLVVRDGRGRQVLDWEEPHGTMRYDAREEPLKQLLVNVGVQRNWKRTEADRSIQKLRAIGVYDVGELAEALGAPPPGPSSAARTDPGLSRVRITEPTLGLRTKSFFGTREPFLCGRVEKHPEMCVRLQRRRHSREWRRRKPAAG